MRTPAKLEQAKGMLDCALTQPLRQPAFSYLVIGMIPVFFEDFLIEVNSPVVHRSVAEFSVGETFQFGDLVYSFKGVERRAEKHDCVITLSRSGLLTMGRQLALLPESAQSRASVPQTFPISQVDALLLRFINRAGSVYGASRVGAPYLLGMALRIQRPLAGVFETEHDLGFYSTPAVSPNDYLFPSVQIDDLSSAPWAIRPICDMLHQTFGRERSPSFKGEGPPIARYRVT